MNMTSYYPFHHLGNRLHCIGDYPVWIPPDGTSLVRRAQEYVLNLLHGDSLRLRHHEEHVDEAGGDNGCKHKEETRVSDGGAGNVRSDGIQRKGWG